MFKKPLAILLSTLMATAAIVGVSAPAQASSVNVAGQALSLRTQFVQGASATVSGGVATFTTTSPHFFVVGDTVSTSGFTPASFNLSNVVVTAATATTFSVASAGADPSTTAAGVITKAPKVFTLTNVVGNGTEVTFTTASAHNFVVGERVSVRDVITSTFPTPTQFRYSDVAVTAVVNPTTFKIASTVQETYDSGGIVRSNNIGVDMALNQFIDYKNLYTSGAGEIHARITVKGMQDMEGDSGPNLVEALDGAADTDPVNSFLGTTLDFITGVGDSYADFEIEFYTGTPDNRTPVTLTNLNASFYDLDGLQYTEVSGFSTFTLSNDTVITPTPAPGGATRFSSTLPGQSGNDSFTKARVSIVFAEVSSFRYRIGQQTTTADTGSANYDLDLSVGWDVGGNWTSVAAQPVARTALEVVASAPYEGPVLGTFSDRILDPCTPKSITITGTKLSGAKGSIQGKAVTVLENTDTKLVIATPAGLTPARGVDLVITSPYGTLTHQNAFDIPAGVCSQTLSKGRWTQIQSDGKTVKMYAKDPIGDGKIQFFVDGKELAWITAVDATDPKLSFASSFPYLVRSVDLKPGKNRFEIRVDGKRVWRATYVPRG